MCQLAASGADAHIGAPHDAHAAGLPLERLRAARGEARQLILQPQLRLRFERGVALK